jgi:hypothetical protein
MPPEYDDAICNLMMGLEHVYRMRFEKMWKTFEEVCKEYHSLRRGKEDHDYMEIK